MTTYIHADQHADGSAGHIGGKPRLSPGAIVPNCELCGTRQTFFFQLTFPADHTWSGRDVAVFACVDCVDEDQLIPDMLQGGLRGASVPANFLSAYQKNFRLLVGETNAAQEVSDYAERVAFHKLGYSSKKQDAIGLCGGSPKWVLENEAPAEVAGAPAVFLFQLFEELRFPTLPSAPGQMKIGLAPPPQRAAPGSYKLFLANALYFFGPKKPGELVYVLTQVDR